MTLKSKFKVENPVVFLFSIFYIIAGAVEVFYLVTEKFAAPPHIGVLGLLSLITAYGLFKMRKWSVLLVTALFFLGITFGAITLYNSVIWRTFEGELLLHTALIAYMIMLLIACVYVVAKREKFE
jgi:4-amino-4-deoxy-L-arabinose transferase-like glycosyltransferase